MEKGIFFDGDFSVKNSECEYYCSPTWHPAQTGPEWKYGCTNKNHPYCDPFDFVPIVKCGGKKKNCEIKTKEEK